MTATQLSRPRARSAGLLLASLFLVTACSGTAATLAPTAAPTTAPTAAPTAVPTAPPSAAPSEDAPAGDQARGMGWNAFDPCELLDLDALAVIMGAPVTGGSGSGASGGGKSCTWTAAGGEALTIATADPETFDSMRAGASGAEDVPGLGSGAYIAGDQLVVHGGAVAFVVEASGGPEVAIGAARAFLGVLAVL